MQNNKIVRRIQLTMPSPAQINAHEAIGCSPNPDVPKRSNQYSSLYGKISRLVQRSIRRNQLVRRR